MNATETVADRLSRLGIEAATAKRPESLEIASPLVSDAIFVKIATAIRLRKADTIILPAHRYESLSRGRGWARKGRGDDVTWGERVDGGYEVGPGRWTVGATDGFARKDSDVWTVTHVAVGDQVWTIAN